MATTNTVLKHFAISDRGLVVVMSGSTNLPAGGELRAKVTTPDGRVASFPAFKEWILARNPTPIEEEAFLLVGATKIDVPLGSRIDISHLDKGRTE